MCQQAMVAKADAPAARYPLHDETRDEIFPTKKEE
jgi:hypothetical protein